MSAAAEIPWTPQNPKTELHRLFENAPFALAQCQRSGTISTLNPALEQMLGGGSRIARSLCFADLIHPRDRAEAEQLFSELFELRRDSFQLHSQIIGADSRRVRWTAWRVRSMTGCADYVLAFAEDDPRNRESGQHGRQPDSLEAVGRLAGGVAHDFNNLLTGVLLYCDLLLANLEPRHRVRKYAEEIRNAGMQATGLVRQLLAVARPTTSDSRLVSLNDTAEGMRNLLVRLMGENIELKFHLDPNLGPVKMDPTQSQQILLNLVLNARDATAGGGQITVETSNCEVQLLTQARSATTASFPCVLFVVADSGAGMDADSRAHLFEAFFTTKAGKGTGLGLATVHDLVTRNGGLIHVESAPARGTRVSVLLPRVSPAILDFEKHGDCLPKTTPASTQIQTIKAKEED